MTEPAPAPKSDVVDWFGGAIERWWVWLAPAGFVAGWGAMAAALAAGGWAAGDLVPPTPVVTVHTLWIAVSDGARLDEAWLLASDADAVAPAAYLWVIFAATLATTAAAASAAVQWWRAGRPTTLGAVSNERRPSRRFRSRRWPLRPPYTPQQPGPGVLLGRERGRLTVARDGLPVLVVGPTGSGKTRHLIGPNVANWPGPVVATSVKTDLADYTAAHRASRGRCFGFDPGGALWPWMRSVGITPVVWDPIRLLAEDPTHEHAKLLAQFLVSHSSAHDAGSQGIWSTLAGEVLASVLLIAADLDQPLNVALRWMIDVDGVFFNNKKNSEFAVAIRESPSGRLSDEAARALRDLRLMAQNDPRIWGSIEVTIREVTGALTNTAERHPDAELVPVDLTVHPDRRDTLFLVADHMTQSTYRSVFAAVVRHLFHITESTQPDAGRLPDRPLFALDELANLARIEDLPEVLSTIRARAQVIVGIQEVSQLVSGWGRDKATTVVGNLPTKAILPGSSDSSALRRWADLSGDHDNYALDTWRTVKTGRARILAGNRDPFEIKLADPKRWMPKIDPPAPKPPPESATEQPATSPRRGPEAEPDPELEPEPEAGAVTSLCRRLWSGGSARLRRGCGAMFGPLPEQHRAGDRPANWADLAGRLGVADLLEPPEKQPNGHNTTPRPAAVAAAGRGMAVDVSDGGDETPAVRSRTAAVEPGESHPEPHGALLGPVRQQLRVVTDQKGPYGLHGSGFVVDLSPHQGDDPEAATADSEEVT